MYVCMYASGENDKCKSKTNEQKKKMKFLHELIQKYQKGN